MEGHPSSSSTKQQATEARTMLSQAMLSQATPLGPRPSPFNASTSAQFFAARREREPAFALATTEFEKPSLRSSQILPGLARLEGARGLVSGTGAFHPVQPHSGQLHSGLWSSDQNGSSHVTSMANGSHPFPSQHRTIDDTTEDKRLSKRKRKASNHEGSVCTICGVTVRPTELPAHFEIEVERLNKLTRPGKANRESASHSKKVSTATSSLKKKKDNEDEGLEHQESRREEYRRVKRNRLERLNARLGRCRKGLKKPSEEPPSSVALCPICHKVLTGTVEERNTHAEACLRKVTPSQADVDEDVNVDGDEEFEQYTWCGQTRIRATSMLDSRFKEAGFEVARKENDCDTELNVDDDDTAEYGPEQYSEADIIPCPSDDSTEDRQRQALRDAVVGNDERASPPSSVPDPWLPSTSDTTQPNRTEAVAQVKSDTMVECLKTRVRELQEQLDATAAVRIKCLICMEPFSVPLVSIQCWHVHCQQCWLRTLGAKKLCPQCNIITSPGQLRRIYL